MAESTTSRKTGRAGITASRKTRPRGYISDYKPQAKTLDLIKQVKAILSEYRPYWPLTIRQVFYRLVGRYDYAKDEAAYERLCGHMNNARRARIIPFEAIRDDGVTTVRLDHYEDSDHFRRHVREMAERYRRNVLADQRIHLEVWCEAAGMIFQLDEVARRYSVHVYSSSGFDSTTARKALADRICDIGKPAIILHLGDYDPSGEAIYQSLVDDVTAFVLADRPWANVTVDFERIALTSEQVAEHGLPTAPAKSSDSRSRRWLGETCQLEALAPDQIAALLDKAIASKLDETLLTLSHDLELADREDLTRLLIAGPSAEGR